MELDANMLDTSMVDAAMSGTGTMDTISLIVKIVYIVICVALVAIVLSQEGKQSGLSGAIGGGSSDTFFGKNKSKTLDSMLSRTTTVLAIVFLVLTVAMGFFLS